MHETCKHLGYWHEEGRVRDDSMPQTKSILAGKVAHFDGKTRVWICLMMVKVHSGGLLHILVR